MKRQTRLIIIMVLLVIAIIAIAVPTYAVWSNGSDIGGAGTIVVNDLTYRYLVLDGVTSLGKHFYMTYDNGGFFKYNSEYNIYDEEVDLNATTFAYISVIGYTGTLGEYEDLVIPSTITWHEGESGAGTSHDDAPITHVNIQSPAAFPTLKGIKSVTIKATLTDIEGVSFSFWPKLTKVTFENLTSSDYSTLVSTGHVSTNAFLSDITITKEFKTA